MYRALNLLVLATLLFAPTVFAQDPAVPADEPVKLDSGRISGARVGDAQDVRVYKGIPFAAPPIGPLRWKPPQPVAAWEGVRACTEYGASCPQPKSTFGGDIGKVSEDCLFLNVWTPAKKSDEKHPVMVWIHGGGHTTGSGSMAIYDGTNFARRGVVLVTVNYRLGPLGFLAHPLLSKESEHNVSGNYGLLDQIAALQWVKKNIAAFGGDPGCVTIFGESAGASSVTTLMISPLVRGLFQRVIAESGFAGGFRKLREPWMRQDSMEEMGRAIGREIAGTKPEADVLKALRAATPEDLLKVSNPVAGLFGKGNKFRPTIDGWVIPDDPTVLFQAGKAADVPFLTGTNANEGNLFLAALPIKRVEGYRFTIQKLFEDSADEILQLYPATKPEEIPAALDQVVGDASFVAPARAAVRAISKGISKAYLYHFTRVAPNEISAKLGAFHAAEIPYVFANGGSGARSAAVAPEDAALSKAMGAYWVNFATTGNPNGEGLTEWPAYDAETDPYLELGTTIQVGKNLHQKGCDLFDRIGAKLRGTKTQAAKPEDDGDLEK